MIRPLLFGLALAASLAHADERTIIPAHEGPSRLDPDAEFLAHAKPDLGDLRIVDLSGREQPFLVIAASTVEPKWIAGRVLPVAATKKTSGFELDLGAAHGIDRVSFDGIAAPFLKRAQLEGSGDRAHWTVLAPDATVFDLPDEKLRNVEISFEPGDNRYLRVTWDDRSSAVVTHVGSVTVRLHATGAGPDVTRVSLQFHKISSEPQKSRYRITLPGPNLPIVAIEAVVANGEVFRPASVYAQRLEQGQIVPVLLGASTLKRAERFGGVASDLAVLVSRPTEADLELVVDDGNNPPLALTGIVARLAPLPWIWFEATAGSFTARYGNPRLEMPAYDVEASRNSIARSAPPLARWGSGARPSVPEAAETETIASFRGAAIDRGDFHYARSIGAAPAGVTRLLLDADVLARSREIADVRLVDARNRQVPYIVESIAAPLTVALAVPARSADGSSSRYAIELPYDTLPPGTRLVVTTAAKVFERNVTLRAAGDDRRGREPYVLASETWRSTQLDLPPPPLSFELASNDSRRIELVINEGDNAPLPVASATLQLPSVALRFYNSGSPLTLLYGNSHAAAPQYDLALLAPRVLGEPARDLGLDTPVTAATGGESTLDVKIFWIALAVVTLVLLGVLVRLIGSRATATTP
jgi:Protein of unknown function (DUF3999)